jgi:hypothetical protein
MRRLIMCCDGTWYSAGQLNVGNVRRLYNALADTTTNGDDQLARYQSGVGAEAGALSGWLLAGVAGFGLSQNVIDAYQWLTETYRQGDKIALFGFSRGAYTARSLAGMIATCGLIDTARLDKDTVRGQIEEAYHRRYRLPPDERKKNPGWREGLQFRFDPEDADRMPVDFIGVWDTVGSLGIPDTFGLLHLLDRPDKYRFHDVQLNPNVQHGRHAIALDEARGPFTPTLWHNVAPGQDVKQVYFPGSHMDVGGGHPQAGLSDGALAWMIEESHEEIGLEFLKEVTDQIRPDPLGLQHDDNQGVFGLLEPLYEPLFKPLLEPFFQPRPRKTPMIDNDGSDSSLHESVYQRHETAPITTGPYRPTRTLAPGESTTISVSHRDPWNFTGVYLEHAEYTFTAQGRWTNAGIPFGPTGLSGWWSRNPREVLRFASNFLGHGERLFRRLSRNPNANFILTRREDDLPWMSLVGVVANGTYERKNVLNKENSKLNDKELDRHDRIAIGKGTRYQVKPHRSGYLYAFANDAWDFYGNNNGSVELTVKRNRTARQVRRTGRLADGENAGRVK